MPIAKTTNHIAYTDVTKEHIEYICPVCGFSAAAVSNARMICITKNCNVNLVPIENAPRSYNLNDSKKTVLN